MDKLLDSNLLDELKEIMEEDFVVLLDSYLTESDKQFICLQQACEDKNIEQVGRTAHTLKGSCANIGAPAMADLCFQLESKASENTLEGVDALLEELTAVHSTVLNAIGEVRSNC